MAAFQSPCMGGPRAGFPRVTSAADKLDKPHIYLVKPGNRSQPPGASALCHLSSRSHRLNAARSNIGGGRRPHSSSPAAATTPRAAAAAPAAASGSAARAEAAGGRAGARCAARAAAQGRQSGAV